MKTVYRIMIGAAVVVGVVAVGCDTIDEVVPESKGLVCGDLRYSGQHPEGAYLLCLVTVLQEEIENLEAELDACRAETCPVPIECPAPIDCPVPVDCPAPIECPVPVDCPSCNHNHKDKKCKN